MITSWTLANDLQDINGAIQFDGSCQLLFSYLPGAFDRTRTRTCASRASSISNELLDRIETQHELFGSQNVERLVEIGPTATLTNIAKRTVALTYQEHDDANGLSRQLLSTKSHADEIYYRFEPFEELVQPDESLRKAQANKALALVVTPPPILPPPLTQVLGHAATIPDEPISAIYTVRAIAAVKLRRQDGALPPQTSTIKDLCGGRSTLQNELIGDLLKEFGSLPDGSEDLTLGQLSLATQSSFNGQLGSTSRSLISRMVTNKLFGGTSITDVRTYLERRWRLGMGRQDAVLLGATTIQPGGRVASKRDSETFIDSAVEEYARNADLILTADSHEVPQESTTRHGLLPQNLKNEVRVESSLSAVSTQKPRALAETDASAERIEYLEKKIRA
ncbi:MAG: hypothetical protein Q9164_007522, partial [Protoblastenia rupestris]